MKNPPPILKAPFPWFGGKSSVAGLVWQRFGDAPNYIEPFFGSGAVLLGRPHEPHVETVNDKDGYVANFWRAVQHDPEAVAHHADNPVNENDLHARHSWLVERKSSFAATMDGNPEFYDAKVAGWWAWGISCWIGSGWCSGKGPWQSVEMEDGTRQLVHLSDAGQGVNRQRVHLSTAGQGVNRQLVHLGNAGRGVNRKPVESEGLLGWLVALAERLKRVRVCCGDWRRVCGGNSGNALKHFFAGGNVCAVFLDPPYADTADRTENLYDQDDLNVAHDVREWAISQGDDPRLRIALCGYEGEHKMPDSWDCVPWKARGGYGSQSAKGNDNARRERIWFSPHCIPVESKSGLFAEATA